MSTFTKPHLPLASLAIAASLAVQLASGVERFAPCCINIVEKGSRWPVPMVELRTNHEVRFVSDNAGLIAFDLPELMGKETWLAVSSDGYEVPVDHFGKRGVRVTPRAGTSITIEVQRTGVAKRLGRLTGAGLFGESQKAGFETDWKETGVLGCDSVQNAIHNGRLFWAWGDTAIASYPLGIFDMSSATTDLHPLASLEPPLRLKFNYFTDHAARPRAVAKMPGEGPTWLTGFASLPDNTGKARLVATYTKIRPPLEGYECGLCVWNDKTENFEQLRTVWSKSKATPKEPAMPRGHSVIIDGQDGKKSILFGDPFPTLRCAARFEAWQDPANWEQLASKGELHSSHDGKTIRAASGAIAFNAYRKRWVTIFMQVFGTPSAFGEIWYAEADNPLGPWGAAVKVLSHENYAFYNPQLHQDLTSADSPILLFEGTRSKTFANHPEPTPRYEYNQILYRVDLDDPKLAPARAVNRN